MMELITRTARLVPYAKRPKQVPSFVTAFVYEPPVDDPATHLGSLFVIVEVLLSGRPGEDIASLIIATLEKVYYSSDKSDKDGPDDPLSRFEAATKAVNAALSEHVNQGNAAWIGKLSAILAVQSADELHLSHTGSADAYLYRSGTSTRITNGLTERATGPAKTFGSIVSGHLEASDHLLLATPALVHQVSLTKLHDIVGDNAPNTTINELTEILKGSDTTRIAALVIELTTPELAALQVRTDHPDEITIGAPENPIQAAKLMAAPIADATVATGKRAGKAAQVGWNGAKPKLQRLGLGAAALMRTAFAGERIARRASLAVLAVIIIGGIFLWHEASSKSAKRLVDEYRSAYTSFTNASAATDTETRRKDLTAALANAKQLATQTSQSRLNKLLSHANLATGAPKTLSALEANITSALNSLDGLVTVSPTTLTNFSAIKDAAPGFMELAGQSLYVVDRKTSAIYVVNLSTNSASKAPVDTSKLGHIVGTAASSAGDGIYLLTSQPSVWFYRYNGASLTQISLGLTGWESATSIASYAGNLYLLSGNQVEKHVRTSTGYAPGVDYLVGTSTVPSPSALGVDGYVYVAGTDGLYQYLAGAAKTSVAARSGLTKLSSLRSDGNNNLIGVDASTGRIGLWTDATDLTFVRQYALGGINTVTDAVYDPTTSRYYAIADGRIVSFSSGH